MNGLEKTMLMLFMLLLLAGVGFSTSVYAGLETSRTVWVEVKKDYLMEDYEFTFKDDQVCWKVPDSVERGDYSALARDKVAPKGRDLASDASNLDTAPFVKEGKYGSVTETLDLTRDGCTSVMGRDKVSIGFGTAEYKQEEINITALDNTDNCLINCYLDLEISTGINLSEENITATFVNAFNGTESIDFEIKHKEGYTVPKICRNNSNWTEETGNGTVVHWDYSQYECGTETRYRWADGAFALAAGETGMFRIEGNKPANMNIDVVPVIYGYPINELAWWNSSWELALYYELNATSNQTEFVLSCSDFGCNYAQSDFNDTRFIIEWSNGTNEEIYYDLMNYSSNIGARFMLNITSILGNNSNQYDLVVYINNSNAPYNGNMSRVAKNNLGSSFTGLSGTSFPPDLVQTKGAGGQVYFSNGVMYVNATATSDAAVDFVKHALESPCVILYRGKWSDDGGSGASSIRFTDFDGVGADLDGIWRMKQASGFDYEGNAWVNPGLVPAQNTWFSSRIIFDGTTTTLLMNENVGDTGAEGAFSGQYQNYRVENWGLGQLDYWITVDLGYNNSEYYFVGNVTPTPPPVGGISNVTWSSYTENQSETITYDYFLTFQLLTGSENASANFTYNGSTYVGKCFNTSMNYICNATGVDAPLVSVNHTNINGTWSVLFWNSTNWTYYNSTNLTYIDWGLWPTDILAPGYVIEHGTAGVNVTYSNVSGFSGVITGTAEFGGSSGVHSCSNGLCQASITAPSVSSHRLFQVESTLEISYGGETVEREVRFEETGTFDATDASMTESAMTNPANANDSNWATYATYGTRVIFNYTMGGGVWNITNWTLKDGSGSTNTRNIPMDCLGPSVQLQDEKPGGILKTRCWNFTSDTWYEMSAYTPGSYRFYEQSVSYVRNNTLIWVTPFGLTDCSSGVPIMTFFIRDEDSNDLVVVNYTQNFFLTVGGTEYGFHFNGTDDTWDICIYPAGVNGTYISLEQYWSVNYSVRSYAISTPASTLTYYNYTRYMGDDTGLYTFIVEDQYGSKLEGVAINVTKYNFVLDSWEIVSNVVTDYTGTSAFYLTPFDLYRFSFEKTGYSGVSFDFTPSTVSEVTVVMSTGVGGIHPPPDLENMWDDVHIEFSPAEGFYNESQTLQFTVLSNSSSLQSYGVNITFTDTNGSTSEAYFTNVTGIPAGGTVSYATTNNGTYHVQAFFQHYNYSFFEPAPRVYYINQNMTGLARVRAGLEEGEAISGWAFYMLLCVVAMVVAGFITRYSPEGAAVGALATLWFGSLLYPAACVTVLFGGFCITPIYITALATIIGVGVLLALRGVL